MKRKNGFTLVELMIALLVLTIVMGAIVGALVQAANVTNGVGQLANMQEDLRAGMRFMTQDLMQAGEGIPQGGISIPNNGTNPAPIVRPGTGGGFFSATSGALPQYLALPAVIPGYQLGQAATGVNPVTSAVLATGAVKTDVITMLYADNILVDSSSATSAITLNSSPVVSASCAGTINATGTSATLAAGCFTMPGQPIPIQAGNLMMFSSTNGTALVYVTGVNGQTINFAAGDPAGLNGLSAATYPDGTLAALVAGGTGGITMTRVWMVTYYMDSTTNPTRPQLVRQLNYPVLNPSQPIGESINQLQFTYDIINSTAPAGTYPNGAGDATTPNPTYDTPLQFRAVNIFLAGRSEYPYGGTIPPSFFYNNLITQVCIRNLAFDNLFN